MKSESVSVYPREFQPQPDPTQPELFTDQMLPKSSRPGVLRSSLCPSSPTSAAAWSAAWKGAPRTATTFGGTIRRVGSMRNVERGTGVGVEKTVLRIGRGGEPSSLKLKTMGGDITLRGAEVGDELIENLTGWLEPPRAEQIGQGFLSSLVLLPLGHAPAK